METVCQKEWDILIIPCWGESYLARLVLEAAEELAAEKKVRVLQEKEIGDLETVKEAINNSDRCITADGCNKQCMLERLEGHKCRTEFNLNLTEIGINDKEQRELDPEDLELAKSLILAVSLRFSLGPPVLPGCCC